MAQIQLSSDDELFAAIAALLRSLPFGRELPREVKWRSTEQIANELGLHGQASIDRIDRILLQHELLYLQRLEQNLAADAVIRRAKYPDRTTALPLWGSVEQHGQPWVGNRPDRTDPPEDIPHALLVPDGAPKVFFSYAKRDSALSLRVGSELARMSIGCWRFETHIEQKGNIAGSVRNAITEAAGLVFLVTRFSIASLWVLTEVQTCLEMGRSAILIVDSNDTLLLKLLQSVKFSDPDTNFDFSVTYDHAVVTELNADYALLETESRAERYASQVHDFLVTLPTYLGNLPQGASKRSWNAMLAFPQPPPVWSGFIQLHSLQELPLRLKLAQSSVAKSRREAVAPGRYNGPDSSR